MKSLSLLFALFSLVVRLSANVFTIYPATPITSPLNPTTFSFREAGVWSQKDLIDPDYVSAEWGWDTTPPDFLSHTYTFGGPNVTIAGGVLNILGTTGASFSGFDANQFWEAPCIGITVPVLNVWGTGTTAILTFGISSAYSGSIGNAIQLRWDRVAQTIAVATAVGNTVTNLGSASFTAPSTPFELGLSISGVSVVAQVRPLGGAWSTVCAGAITLNDATFDIRSATTLASFPIISLQTAAQGNNGTTLTLGNVRYGYLHGQANYSDKMVRCADGTPLQSGGEQFMISSVQDVPGNSNEGVTAAQFSILAVNPLKKSFRTQAKIFVNRGGKIFGENSGVCIYDPVGDDFIYLIPNWGDWRVLTQNVRVQTYVYRRRGFPSGVIVLSGGTVFTGLPTSTSDYDPDLQFYGGLWHMVYTQTNTTINWSSYATVHATTPTFSPSATWTQVAAMALGRIEGPKIFKVGGTRYIIQFDTNASNQLVTDENLSPLGTFATPANTGANGIGHACLMNYWDGDKDRIFWLYFDGAERDGIQFSWGKVHILENTSKQTGHDYPFVTLLDISDAVIGPGSPGYFLRRF